MIVACYCCRGSAEERQSRIGELWNSCRAGVTRAVEFVGGWLGPRPASQCSFLDVDPNIKSHKIIFKKIVQRGTVTPYEFKFYDPTHIIAGIACGPQDDKTSSPEAEVVDGGIGCHLGVIRL